MAETTNSQKISQALRVDPALLAKLESRLRPGVFDDVIEENEELIRARLKELGLNGGAGAAAIYDALINKAAADDSALLKLIGRSAAAICDYAKGLHQPPRGFFLRKEKAKELLIKEPPAKILQVLGYKQIEDLLVREDLLEVFTALRFLEERDWLNNVFFKQYNGLTPADFEERPVEFRPLPQKWAEAAEKFVGKKYHNISHLKELGVIFAIPVFLGISGETLRALSLIVHYLYEIEYYSDLFRRFSREPASFARNLISALRGDVLPITEYRISGGTPAVPILVIQRYLAKDDANDPRLFYPHVNPEAIHWQKAIRDINRPFWQNLDWVGRENLSFNLVDMVMSLVQKKEMTRYAYHRGEALWNKIFIEHFGQEKTEELSKANIIRGWFDL